jgi:hypothetical protein
MSFEPQTFVSGRLFGSPGRSQIHQIRYKKFTAGRGGNWTGGNKKNPDSKIVNGNLPTMSQNELPPLKCPHLREMEEFHIYKVTR